MKRKMITALTAILVFLAGCSATPADKENTFKTISAEEAYTMMNEQDVLIVDVRTEEEYEQGHIADAILIPNETITDSKPEQLPDQQAVILVYCRSGNRSKQAAEKLVKMGYTHVLDFGGIRNWPYEIIKE